MRSPSLRLAFFVSAVTAAACSGDNFSETDVPAAGAGGAAGQAGKAGSATAGSATGGTAGSGVAGTGATGGNQSAGGKSGSSVGGADAGGSDAGGSDAGGSDGGSSVGGSSAGTGGTAGASGSNAGGKAGAAGGGAGTNAGGQAGAGAGGAASGSAGVGGGGAAGANAGGSAGVSAGGSAGANAGGAAGAGAGGSAGGTAGGAAGASAGGSAGSGGGAAGGGGQAGAGGSGNPWGEGKCDPLGGFDAVVAMPAPINEAGSGRSDIDGWFDPSQNVIVWSKGGAGADLWFGRLSIVDGTTWENLDDLKGSHSGDTERFPSLANNLTTLYLTSNRSDHAAGWHIYRIQPTADGGLAGWDPAKNDRVAITDSLPNHREFGGQVTPLEEALYFASTRMVNKAAFSLTDLDLYVQLNPATPGGAVTAIASVNKPNVEESHPAISPDQRILYYATKEGAGSLDVWATWRLSTNEAFGTPVRLDAIATAAVETPSWISEDYCTVLFTRTEGGSSKIYKGTRLP